MHVGDTLKVHMVPHLTRRYNVHNESNIVEKVEVG